MKKKFLFFPKKKKKERHHGALKLMYSVTNITKLFILKQLCRYFGAMRRYCFFPFVKTFILYVLLKLICQTSRERVASGGIIAIINGLRDLSRVFHYNY